MIGFFSYYFMPDSITVLLYESFNYVQKIDIDLLWFTMFFSVSMHPFFSSSDSSIQSQSRQCQIRIKRKDILTIEKRSSSRKNRFWLNNYNKINGERVVVVCFLIALSLMWFSSDSFMSSNSLKMIVCFVTYFSMNSM